MHVHRFVPELYVQPGNGKLLDPCGSGIIVLPEPVVKTTLMGVPGEIEAGVTKLGPGQVVAYAAGSMKLIITTNAVTTKAERNISFRLSEYRMLVYLSRAKLKLTHMNLKYTSHLFQKSCFPEYID